METILRNSKVAVYAGSFDPPTNGHIWIMNQAMSLFDHVIVAIGVNPEKKATFSLEDRIQMLNDIADRLRSNHGPQYLHKENQQVVIEGTKITIDHFENMFLIDYAEQQNAQFIVRGVRNTNDYNYEHEMSHFNSDPTMGNAGIKTVWFPCPKELSGVSSSFVKGLCGPKEWEERVKGLVPPVVFKHLRRWKNKFTTPPDAV